MHYSYLWFFPINFQSWRLRRKNEAYNKSVKNKEKKQIRSLKKQI
jgi:hypothetical protein